MYAGGGALIDRLGTRRGFLVIMVAWSLACAAHGFATGLRSLAISRFLLGAGEGGGFPAATKAVAEWFPARERSTAMGIINAGTAIGAVVAPPLIAAIVLSANWRWAFYHLWRSRAALDLSGGGPRITRLQNTAGLSAGERALIGEVVDNAPLLRRQSRG